MKFQQILTVLASSLIVLIAFGCTNGAITSAAAFQQSEEGSTKKPDGFKQLLPRGKIASIDKPEFVSASEAKIPADAYVLGVVVEDQPIAYSLNLLNSHEIVNDSVGETKFAAVW